MEPEAVGTRRFVRTVGAVLTTLGLAVLCGWSWEVLALQEVLIGWPSMTANTAVGFVGVGLSYLALGAPASASQRALLTLGLLVTVFVGATALFQGLFGVDLGIDELLASDPRGQARGVPPGRMAIGTALEFLLLAGSTLWTFLRRARSAQLFAALALVLAAAPAIGFSYFSRWAHATLLYETMALHTTLAFLLASSALVTALPGLGFAAHWSGSGAGAQLLRRLGAPLLFGSWLIGWICQGLKQSGTDLDQLLAAQQLSHIGLAAVLVTISARRLQFTEQQRRMQELRMHTLFHASPDALVLTDDSDRIAVINAKAQLLFGSQGDTALGGQVADFLPETVREQYIAERSVRRSKSAEHPIWRRSVSLRARWRQERLVPLELRLTPIAGGPELLHTLRDVTVQEHLEEQLRHAQKMLAIGELAAGIAHDYNNLAQVIESCTGFLFDRFDTSDESHEDIMLIRETSRRGASLAKQLLSSSRRQVLSPQPHSLTDVVRSMFQVLESAVGADVDLRLRLADDLWTAQVDRGHFEQIVFNLVTNARQAMPQGGQLTLETANAQLGHEYANARTEIVPGEYVLLAVTDTGVGIPPELRERIFEPFFTTKERGLGTGLGLAMCYGIIRQLGGHIWMYSEVGRGTTFKIYLPRFQGAVADLPPKVLSDKPLNAPRRILVVEDDRDIRAVTQRMLQGVGHEIFSAANAAEARELLKNESDIALILCDLIMPGESGAELARWVEQNHPSIQVLYMSGYTEDGILHDVGLREGENFLGKPFSAEQLHHSVNNLLDS